MAAESPNLKKRNNRCGVKDEIHPSLGNACEGGKHMALRLLNLDSRTRQLMLDELEHDVERGELYFSPRLSERGRRDYESLMRAAIESLNDVLLADSLRVNDRLKNWENRHGKNGEVNEVKVPFTAADTL